MAEANSEPVAWVLCISALCALSIVAIVTMRGCAESRERKVRIEYMPEDAQAVRQLLEGIK